MPVEFCEELGQRDRESGQNRVADETIGSGQILVLVDRNEHPDRPSLGIDLPDESDSGPKVFVPLPGHLVGSVTGGKHLDDQIRGELRDRLGWPTTGRHPVPGGEGNVWSSNRAAREFHKPGFASHDPQVPRNDELIEQGEQPTGQERLFKAHRLLHNHPFDQFAPLVFRLQEVVHGGGPRHRVEAYPIGRDVSEPV
jgi:hypothetical protein